MSVLFVTLVFLLYIYIMLQWCSRKWRMLRKYPGDFPLPIVGNGFKLGFDTDKSAERIFELWKKYGMENFRLSVGVEDWLLVTNPDDVAIILNHPTELTKQVERNAGMKLIFGNSISTSNGERWKITRKLMAPSFHFKTLDKNIQIINDKCDNLFDYWDNEKNEVDIYRYVKPFTFDIVCDSLMGIDLNLLDSGDYSYFEASDKVIELITENYFSYWRIFQFFFTLTELFRVMKKVTKILSDKSYTIIARKKDELQLKNNYAERNNKLETTEDLVKAEYFENTSLLERLLLSNRYNGASLSDKMIIDEINLICWTGHHSTSLVLAHALYCIAKYPEVQQKILEEQHLIFHKNTIKKPTFKELTEMKYLEVVIKESIRIIPTITIIARHLNDDLALKDGRVVPSNTTLIVFYKAMYQDPKLFSEPEKFIPERFFSPMHNYAFVPFSAGPRNCLGIRYTWALLKTTISNIVRRYELSPGTEPQFASRMMTESKNGIRLFIKKRTNEQN